MFEGICGSSYMGDIALDDVAIEDGACPTARQCDFEANQCRWSNIGGDDFNWKRDNKGTPSTGTGPTKDHTTGTTRGEE